MKRILIACVTATMMMTIAPVGTAAEPTLDTTSLDAYRTSIVMMSEPLEPEGARALLLRLMTLATGEKDRQAAMRIMMANPDAFLAALSPYNGKTATEIMTAAEQ